MAMDPVTVGTLVGAGKGLVQGKDLRGIAQDAAIGAAGGYLGGKLPFGDMFKGVTPADATSTATANSLESGTSLLGSNTGNTIPLNNVGMGGQTANLTGFTAPAEQTLLASNSYQPLGGGIAPDMSFKQQYINMTPDIGVNRLGSTTTPDYVSSLMTNDPTKQMQTANFDTSARNIDGTFNKINQAPQFDNITKSTPEEIAAAQGGFEKPLYERAFDSVVGFAEENPVAMAGLGLTALSAGNTQQPPISPRAGQAIKGTYTPTQPYKIRRAT